MQTFPVESDNELKFIHNLPLTNLAQPCLPLFQLCLGTHDFSVLEVMVLLLKHFPLSDFDPGAHMQVRKVTENIVDPERLRMCLAVRLIFKEI